MIRHSQQVSWIVKTFVRRPFQTLGTCEDIIVEKWSVFVFLTAPTFVSVWSKHFSIFFGRLRQSSGDVRKSSGKVWKRSPGLWTNFRKYWEIVGKWRRCVLWTFYIINRKLHGRFIFSCWIDISLACCAHSWNIFQHSKLNFVSPRGRVISSTCFKPKSIV